MSAAENEKRSPQQAFAGMLHILSTGGFILLVATFAIYLSGLLPARLACGDVPRFWKLSAHDFLEASGASGGWAWLARLDKSDVLMLAVLTFFTASAAIGFAALVVIFIAGRNRVYALFAALQIVIIVLAALGVFG